jgi:Protein of unknown function (DUF3237)
MLPMSKTDFTDMRHLFDAELHYQEGMAPVRALEPGEHLVGSGTGHVNGSRIRGALRWSNFEVVFDDYCRLNIVGTIQTDDGAEVSFDSQGFAVPPPGTGAWKVASAVRFAVEDARYRWLQAVPAVWQGEFDATAATARYRAYRPIQPGRDEVQEGADDID